MTEAQQIAEALGMIVGVVSCCEQVTEERLNAVAGKLRDLVVATADDEPDADLANEQFSAALQAGKAAVESGKIRIDPEQADDALNELEQQLSA